MKLLLDEMYPAAIAEQLRRRGHDVLAVTEQRELRALPDERLFEAAQTAERAVVTENIADFVPIANRLEARGGAHHGLVLVSPRSYPRGRPGTIGRIVEALDRMLQRLPEPQTPGQSREWL